MASLTGEKGVPPSSVRVDLNFQMRSQTGSPKSDIFWTHDVLAGWNRMIPNATGEAFDLGSANKAIAIGTFKSDLGTEANSL